MKPDEEIDRLDRHALALTIWLTAGVVAATLYRFGVGAGQFWSTLGAFAAIAAAFLGHVIANVVLVRDFTTRELALGLVIYAAGLIAFGLATLLSPDFAARGFLATSLGFVGLMVEFVFYLVVRGGVRPAFESFDVIRSFRAKASSEGERRV